MTQVYIVAGGPGDPELITVKGQRLIDQADIIFRGRRFSPDELFVDTKADCRIYEYFNTSYEEKMEIVKKAVVAGQSVVFVNMGDPCLFGMISGLADRLEKAGIAYEIVPGVSAYNAACAILKKQMTGIGIPNTAVCTTCRDRDDAMDNLQQVAGLGASVALFMSVERIEDVCAAFLVHCPPETPAAVVADASRPDQQVVKGTLSTISAQVRAAEIHDGIILIGEFIDKPYDYEAESRFLTMKETQMRHRPLD